MHPVLCVGDAAVGADAALDVGHASVKLLALAPRGADAQLDGSELHPGQGERDESGQELGRHA